MAILITKKSGLGTLDIESVNIC